MDEKLILYAVAAVMSAIGFYVLWRESKKRQEAIKEAEAEFAAEDEKERQEKLASQTKKLRKKSHGKRIKN